MPRQWGIVWFPVEPVGRDSRLSSTWTGGSAQSPLDRKQSTQAYKYREFSLWSVGPWSCTAEDIHQFVWAEHRNGQPIHRRRELLGSQSLRLAARPTIMPKSRPAKKNIPADWMGFLLTKLSICDFDFSAITRISSSLSPTSSIVIGFSRVFLDNVVHSQNSMRLPIKDCRH